PGTSRPETRPARPGRAPRPLRKGQRLAAIGPGSWVSGPEESTSMPVVTPVADLLNASYAEHQHTRPLTIRSLIERPETMRRRVLSDFAADPGTHLGAVAPVHPAPHPRVAFFGMDITRARVVPNGAVETREGQRELIGAEPHRIKSERGPSDRGVSRGIF